MKDSTLSKAARDAVSTDLDHFPPLVVHRSLAGDLSLLERAARAHIDGRIELDSEVISFPRRGFAPRPIEILSGSALAAYKALVAHLAPTLPNPSRDHGKWGEHQDFGFEAPPDSYVVDIDYTACYELIDHQDLKQELLLRSFDVDAVENLDRFLAALGRRGRGLPQMLAESDLLADTYLSVIDRALRRRGYILHRYADDVRIVTSSWSAALQVVEEAADMARELGLLLSSAKTSVRLSATLRQKDAEIQQVLRDRLDNAVSASIAAWISRNVNPYEDDDDYEDESDADTYDEDSAGGVEGNDSETESEDVEARAHARRSAYWKILQEWHAQFKDREIPEQAPADALFGPHLNLALSQAREYTDDLEPSLLVDLVFEDESRMEHVVKYLLARASASGTNVAESGLIHLLQEKRRTAWSQLWLLHAVETVWSGATPPSTVEIWVREMMSGDREILRAQAAWTLAAFGRFTVQDLQETYLKSSLLSAPALSAASGRQAKSNNEFAKEKTVVAVLQDNELNRGSFAWAQL